MTAEEIGYLLGAIQISRLIGNPLIARAADAWGEARRPLIILSCASLLGFALFLAHRRLRRAADPVPGARSDLHRRRAAERQPDRIGGRGRRLRLWPRPPLGIARPMSWPRPGGRRRSRDYGSRAHHLAHRRGLGPDGGVVLPASPPAAAPRRRGGMLSLLSDPGFLLMLATSAIIQSSHALLYAFGTIHWTAAGHSAGDHRLALGAIGDRRDHAVLGRQEFCCAGSRGPELFVIGAAAALILRWLLAGLGTGLPLLMPGADPARLQLRHHPSGRHDLSRPAQPAGPRSPAPRCCMPSSWARRRGLVTAGPGGLYEALGGDGFFVMAAIAASACCWR